MQSLQKKNTKPIGNKKLIPLNKPKVVCFKESEKSEINCGIKNHRNQSHD